MNTVMLTCMVRLPLSPEQVRAGERLGALIRTARAGRDPELIARHAGISPETLRKIEVGRIPSPSFGTVVGLCTALGMPLQDAVDAWQGTINQRMVI
jgi:DNA-binding Xre family transcriptional regulator